MTALRSPMNEHVCVVGGVAVAALTALLVFLALGVVAMAVLL